MSLGADRIVMTKQAALGPIDPSLTGHPLAPAIVNAIGQPVRISVSAEAIRGYIDEVKKEVDDPAALASVWNHLASQIHPLVLGEIFRLGGQIRTMAKDLIKVQVADADKQDQIIQLLCSDSGSHDYTINRRQASEMGLSVAKPSADLYGVLSEITKSYDAELKTLEPFSPHTMLAGAAQVDYTLVRGLIESTEGGCFGYVSDGQFVVNPGPAPSVSDNRTFEGWRRLK